MMTFPRYRHQSVVTVLLFTCFAICANSQKKSYDFIVVGAGAAGSAITRRLSESGRFSVLLIESGGFPKEGYDVPAHTSRFLGDPEGTFRFSSTPQKNAGLFNNGSVPITAGRVLGGTTSINAMWWNRGNPMEWDSFASITGDNSWSYENMLKYFKQSENYEGDFPSEEHGYNGPMTVSRPRYAPGLDAWLAAGRELGFPVSDPNGPQEQSFTPVEFAKRRGRRVSAFAGYLAPVMDMLNLDVLINANVTNVIFEGNRAVGVNYISNGTESSAKATKEVIISAGAYSSPLILQRSGIGPANFLKAANITLIKDLPVGENFQAHPTVNLNFAINNASLVMDDERDLTPENWQLFNIFGDGPYSSYRGATGQALISSSVATAEGNGDWPDLQLCMSHSTLPYVTTGNLHLTARRLLREGEVPMSCSVFLGRPKSRGTVRINPANILGAPLADLNYFEDPRDMTMALDGIEEILRIFEDTKTYQSLTARYTPVILPPCDQFPPRSTEYWQCYTRHTTGSTCHPVGTNKMGRANDPTAVVDSELRVIGMVGLRVADASIMPIIVNANPQAGVYAIGEKAADMILTQWQGKSPSNSGASNYRNNNNNNRIHGRWKQQQRNTSPFHNTRPNYNSRRHYFF